MIPNSSKKKIAAIADRAGLCIVPSHYSTGAALHIVTTIVLIYKLFMLNMFADYHWRDIVFQMHFQDMLKKIMKSCFKSKMEDILSSSEDVVSSISRPSCIVQ